MSRQEMRVQTLDVRQTREEHIEAAKKPGHLAELIAKLNAMREKSREQGSTVQPEEPKKEEKPQPEVTRESPVEVTEAMLRDARKNEYHQRKLLGDDF